MPTQKLGIIICFLLWTFTGNAQKISADWTEKIKSISGAYKDYKYRKSLPADNESFISVYTGFGKAGIKFVKFNNKLEVLKEFILSPGNDKELFPGVSSPDFSDFVKIGDKFFLVREGIAKSEQIKNVYFQEIDAKELSQTGSSKKMASFDIADDIGESGPSLVGFDYSFDSTRLLMYYEPLLKKKSNKTIQLAVVNEKLQSLVQYKFDFGQLFKQVSISNLSIDNDGKVYITHNNYEKDFEKDYLKSDGDKIPSYTTFLSIVGLDNKATQYNINNQGKFIQQLCMAYDTKNQIVFTGLYKDVYNGRISGICKGKFESTNTGINLNFTAFEDELLQLTEKDGMAKAAGKKKGIDNEFMIRNIVCVNDGVIHMIAEYNGYDVWGDLLIATFLPSGKIEMTRIPKKQTVDGIGPQYSWTTAKGYGYSFSLAYHEDKFYIFYNDSPENISRALDKSPADFSNMEKSSFCYATLNHNGKLITRNEVFNHKDIDKYVTSLHICQTGSNSFILFGLKSGTFTNSIKMGILTIK